MDILLLLVGLGLILGGANFLTDGSAAVAQRFRVPEFIIGLTIVAVGTSTPELVVSVLSAAAGNSDVAIGNVVGSNIFNVLLCLGGASVVGLVGSPLHAVALDVGAMIVFTLVGVVMMRSGRTVTRLEGTILVLGYAAFLVLVVMD